LAYEADAIFQKSRRSSFNFWNNERAHDN
jgi:hypothetical protein